MTPDPLAALFAELGRLHDLDLLEIVLRERGYTRIAGVDEAGRGSLAGPVVAAAVMLPAGCVLPGLDDSKKLDADCRARLAPEIRRRALAVGVGVYALGSALITVVARLDFLQHHRDQIFADRYLVWPTLFWCSLALLLLGTMAQVRSAVVRTIGIGALLVLPVALSVSQNFGAIWGALVYRSSQQTAAALRSGVYDEEHFPNERLGREADLREIALLRDKRLAMFSDPT